VLLAYVGGAFFAVWSGGVLSAALLHGWIGLLPWAIYSVAAYVLGKHYERSWRTWDAAVGADEHGLYLDGRLTLTRRALRHGHLMTEGSRVFLRLHRRAPFAAPYDIEVADEGEARRLLADLRLDPQTSISEFELDWGSERRAKLVRPMRIVLSVLAMLIPVGLLRPLGEYVAVPLFFAGALLSLYFMASNVAQVTVGADGIHVKRTFSRARFIAYADVREVRLWERTLVVELNDDSKLMLHRDEEGLAHEKRIREALAQHRARNVNAAAAVNRGGRTTSEWLEATSDRRPTYRAAHVPDEELWNIVEDAAASPTERAGAALALRKELDDAGRNRLRIAAGACAEKKLRVALESVAENASDEDLEDVLEPLQDRAARRLS
jgi:hypothetical protein